MLCKLLTVFDAMQTRIRELLVAGNVALKRVCGPMELVAALNPEHGSFPKLVGRRNLPM